MGSRKTRVLIAAILLAALTAHPAVARAQPPPAVLPQALAAIWDSVHIEQSPPLLRHAEAESRLRTLARSAPDLFHVEEIGRSVEGRSINHIWFGHGPVHILLWSQMHGDEPTATAALFDLFEFVRRDRESAIVSALLRELTVHVVPMLNPDGAERYRRRNAQGIDINRDALMLQTPEGRALKALRDRLNPRLGFNLHNQNWRTSAGKSGRPASFSLLAVAFDEARSDNDGRILAKRVCAAIREALEPFAPGQIARYDDEFELRAFGDNLTKWGTPIVLIETGAWPSPDPDATLVRLNFVAIGTALEVLATGEVSQFDASRYESLPMNGSSLLYLLVRNASVLMGTNTPPFVADIGVAATRVVRTVGAARTLGLDARVEEFGDLRVFGALDVIDGTGLFVAPLFDEGLTAGQEVQLPDWSREPSAHTVEVGQPADLLLLRATSGPGRYRVERVLRLSR